MTDQQRQQAIAALKTIRAGLGNPHGFDAPDYANVTAEPVAIRDGCYIYQLLSPLNDYTGLVLADALYPIADKADLARAISIIRGWRMVQGERRMQTEREARKRR